MHCLSFQCDYKSWNGISQFEQSVIYLWIILVIEKIPGISERAYESAFWYVYGLLNLTDSSQFNFAFDGPQDATADSVKDGIEQLQQKLIFDINPPENDTVLRFYDACEKLVFLLFAAEVLEVVNKFLFGKTDIMKIR